MNKIEHIGIAVKDLNSSIAIYQKLLDTDCYKTEQVASEFVNTAFFKTGENKVELLQATAPDSAIAKFIEKKGREFIISLFWLMISWQKWNVCTKKVLCCSAILQKRVQIIKWCVLFIQKIPMVC